MCGSVCGATGAGARAMRAGIPVRRRPQSDLRCDAAPRFFAGLPMRHLHRSEFDPVPPVLPPPFFQAQNRKNPETESHSPDMRPGHRTGFKASARY